MELNKEEKLKLIQESLKTVTPDVMEYAQRYQQQKQQEEEFRAQADTIRHVYNLSHAYTLEEVVQACTMLNARYAEPGLRTMKILSAQMDAGVTRQFFLKLAEITQ